MKNLIQIIKKEKPNFNFVLDKNDFLQKQSNPLKYILKMYN